MISQALRKHQTSITRHLTDYAAHQKTNSANGGSRSFINEAKTKLVIQHLSDTTYFHMHEIREHIKTTYDVEYSIPGLQNGSIVMVLATSNSKEFRTNMSKKNKTSLS